jgi:hypothetical protein
MYSFHMLREPIDFVHFANTETAIDWNGYMNGAVESGRRVALVLFHFIFIQMGSLFTNITILKGNFNEDGWNT